MSDQQNSTSKTLLLSMLGGAIVVLVCCVVWYSKCCPVPTTVQPVVPEDPVKALTTEEKPVKDWHLNCLTADFNAHFKVGPDVDHLETLQSGSVHISIEALQREIQELKKIGQENYGLRVHHGLRFEGGHFIYDPAISLGVLEDEDHDEWDFSAVPAGKLYTVSNYGLHPAEATTWSGSTRYTENMWVQRDPGSPTFRRVEKLEDVETYTFNLNDVEQMILHNETSMDAKFLMITSISEPEYHEGLQMPFMEHHVCLLTAKEDYSKIIDNESHPDDFTGRGLDVGSPCPPRCRKAYLPENGTPIRTSCIEPVR